MPATFHAPEGDVPGGLIWLLLSNARAVCSLARRTVTGDNKSI